MVLLEDAVNVRENSNINHLQMAQVEAFTENGEDLQAFSREPLKASSLKVLLTFIPTLKALITKDETRAFIPTARTFAMRKRYEGFSVLRGSVGNEKSHF
jgi:hypothetical protein